MEKIKCDFRLIGLSSPKSGTMELLHTDKYTFWGKFDISTIIFKALLNSIKEDDEFWHTAWIAEVECDKLAQDGCPIRAVIKNVREWDLPYKPYPQDSYDSNNKKIKFK